MTEHLFPESTTYVHSYRPHDQVPSRRYYGSTEANPVEFLPAPLTKKTAPAAQPIKTKQDERVIQEFLGVRVNFERLRREWEQLHEQKQKQDMRQSTSLKMRSSSPQVPEIIAAKKAVTISSTIGNVDINGLSSEERKFFLMKTYTTTYDDYAKTPSPSAIRGLEMKKAFTRQDDKMLKVLNETKPNLAYYGFGLPNQCCVAWGTSQLRTLPEGRERILEAKKHINPFPNYPEKMYPFIANQTLSSHYDGSFPFGYTGHQRTFLEYPEDVNQLVRRDFPLYVPKNITTNQAILTYQVIPFCESKEPTPNKSTK